MDGRLTRTSIVCGLTSDKACWEGHLLCQQGLLLAVQRCAALTRAADRLRRLQCRCRHNQKAKAGEPQKELQFFNTWPAPTTEKFLSMWPPEELAAMRNGTSQKFLFDGSPEYLLNAAVAPRLKQMIPQAKIAIVLRVRPHAF